MKDELGAIYESKIFNSGKELIDESQKVKGAKTIPGKGVFGDEEKAKKMQPGTGPENTDVKGKPTNIKRFSSGEGTVKEYSEKENKNMLLPESEFEKLFKSTLINEEGPEEVSSDESPLEKGDFDDDSGDFAEPGEGTGEPTEEEEVDVATELRMIIDRLTEIAEKLGAYDEEESMEGEEGLEGGEEGLEGEEGVPPVGESHVTKDMKPLPDTKAKMTSKSSLKVPSKVSSPEGGTPSKGGPGKQVADGKLKPLGKGKFGPTMSMKADTTSVMGKQGASLFGSK